MNQNRNDPAGVVNILARLGHDIRVHMTSIVGHAENCAQGKLDASASAEAMEIVVRNSRRLQSLLEVVLNLCERERQGSPEGVARVEPMTFLLGIQAEVEDAFEGRSPRVDLVPRGLLPRSIRLDGVALRNILHIVLKSYLEDVDPQQARVEVGVVRGSGSDALLCLEVKPCAEGTARTVANTSDLGYHVAKELCDVVGAHLSVLRRVNGACEVRMLFPIGALEELDLVEPGTKTTPRKATTGDRPPLEGTRVLVAEDDPDNQKLIRYILERAGAEVTVVADGAEAVNTVDEQESVGAPFDLVLTDIEMPIMDGYEATRQIRMNGHDMPIVALSAQPKSMEDAEVRASGLSEFASKSMGRAGLIQRLREMLDAQPTT